MCDLMITVPFLYYLIVVRRGYSSPVATAAVFAAGARAAFLLLPAVEQPFLAPARWAGIPIEIWLITAILRKLRKMGPGADAVERIHEAAKALFRHERIAELVAGEIEVFYYALFAWRAKPQARAEHRPFTYGDASGYITLSLLLALALVFEGVPLHLLLHRWSPPAAWNGTAMGFYGLIWVAALARSLRLRPVLVGDGSVVLQIGILWRIEIPRKNIKSCRRILGQPPDRRHPGYLPLAVMNEPQWLIELHEPAIARGLYGRRRMVTSIGLAVDDPDAFGAALGSARAQTA